MNYIIDLVSKIKAFSKSRNSAKVWNKIRAFRSIEGWLTDNEALGLFLIARELRNDATVVEIGSWKGKSTYCIAKGLKQGTIHCIDPFNAAGEEGSKEVYESSKGSTSLLHQFKANLSNISTTVKIKTHPGYSYQFINTIYSIDFLFIDGDHSIEGCKFDYENFEKDIKQGGYLAFHDYDIKRPDLGPTFVINNLVKSNRAYKFYKNFDSLTVFKKI